jgi:hypothetical protein
LNPAYCAALLLVVASPALAQRPVLEVRLEGVGHVLVEGRLSSGGLLELPTAPIHELTGASLGGLEFMSLDELARTLGAHISVEYVPRLALLVIRDPARSLPASRARFESLTAASRATPAEVFGRGPFGSLTADSDGERFAEGGWNLGRVAVNGSHSTLSGSRWGAAVRPLGRMWISYQASDRRGSSVNALWAGGRTFARAAYNSDVGRLQGQIGTNIGRLTVFLQREPSDWSTAVTVRGPLAVTIAHTDDRFSSRVSFGRIMSPFTLPRIP